MNITDLEVYAFVVLLLAGIFNVASGIWHKSVPQAIRVRKFQIGTVLLVLALIVWFLAHYY